MAPTQDVQPQAGFSSLLAMPAGVQTGMLSTAVGSSIAHRSAACAPRPHHPGLRRGLGQRGIAKRLHLSATTVCRWRTRFLADRVDGLTDEPRPGAPRRITDTQVEDVVVRTLESTPRGAPTGAPGPWRELPA